MKISEVSVTADVVTEHLCETLSKWNINLNTIYGFGSDGASLMTGRKNGVATQMKNKNPVMVTIHCLAQAKSNFISSS